MGEIRILDDDTVNKIAAGEVVSRPFSVVKELIENSLDAGASKIRVTISNGGKSSIEVVDDGFGMDSDDVELSFTRHATSKLSSVEDLFFLESMGFRGEAIPSIAAVSKLSMRSKKRGSDLGTEIVVEGGKQVAKNSLPLNDGTSILIKDLFYNIPARLKYLKRDQTEFMHILKFVYASSLARPDVMFQLYNGLKKVFSSPGNNKLDEVVSEVFTYDIFKQMRRIEYQYEDVTIHGYISLPSCTKVDRDKQIFFVNKRYIQSDIMGKALRNAITNIFPPQRHPYCFLHISVDPSEVDMNVHPAKMEAKFVNEKNIYRLVYHSIRSIFERGHSFSQEVNQTSIDQIETNQSSVSEKPIISPQSYIKKDFSDHPAQALNLDNIYSDPKANQSTTYNPLEAFDMLDKSADTTQLLEFREITDILQIQNTYLIFWYQEQMLVIDQHIAHERVLYENLLEKKQDVISQELLLPESVFFDKTEEILYNDVKLILSEIGFIIESFGTGTYIIRAVPQFLVNKNAKGVVKDILGEASDTDAKKKYNQVLMSVACKAAVKAGDKLTSKEMSKLVEDWIGTKNNMSCPHGRPIAKIFMKTDIDKWFSRR